MRGGGERREGAMVADSPMIKKPIEGLKATWYHRLSADTPTRYAWKLASLVLPGRLPVKDRRRDRLVVDRGPTKWNAGGASVSYRCLRSRCGSYR